MSSKEQMPNSDPNPLLRGLRTPAQLAEDIRNKRFVTKEPLDPEEEEFERNQLAEDREDNPYKKH